VCPVKINIPDLLLHLRGKVQEHPRLLASAPVSLTERWGMRAWAWVMQRPRLYRLGSRLARLGQRLLVRQGWIRKLPMPIASHWTEGRDFPALAPKSFHERWKERSTEHHG
jgi:L-lactate dehydrogenase complex protein LldF